MDFFTMLKAEHKEVKDLMKELENQEPIDREQCEMLCEKLLLHMEMEEKYFYPRMDEFKKAEELSEEAELEHIEAKKFIRALLKNELDDVEYKVKFEMLKLGIEHHADEEESELFPKAKELLKQDDIQEITEQMMALKEKKTAAAEK